MPSRDLIENLRHHIRHVVTWDGYAQLVQLVLESPHSAGDADTPLFLAAYQGGLKGPVQERLHLEFLHGNLGAAPVVCLAPGYRMSWRDRDSGDLRDEAGQLSQLSQV